MHRTHCLHLFQLLRHCIGSVAQPLIDLPDNGTLTSNTVYLLKRWSYKNSNRKYAFTANNVTFGAYGIGERPAITFDSNLIGRMFDVKGSNMTIENLQLRFAVVQIQESELRSSNSMPSCGVRKFTLTIAFLVFCRSDTSTINGRTWTICNCSTLSRF